MIDGDAARDGRRGARAAAAARRGSRRGRRRAARHQARRTSATSPGSPARPALLLVTARRAGVRHRRPLPRAGGRAARRGRRRRPTSRSGCRRPSSATCSAPRPRGHRPARARGRRVSRGRSSAATRASWFPDAELVADRGPGRGAAPGEGRRRGRPHRGRRRDRRRRARRDRCPTAGATGRPSTSSRSSSTPRCGGAAPTATASRPIVGVGPERREAARPARADAIVERGELVVFDFGALVDGYCSDMTRTVTVGEPGRRRQQRMLDVVAAAQQAGRRRGGAPASTCAAVDAACRDVIADAGWGDAFAHGTGHGVGLEIHEAPAGGARRPMLRSPPATSSPSSPACTSPARRRPHRGHRRRHRRRLPSPSPAPRRTASSERSEIDER